MYCGRCGSQLTQDGLCPKCDTVQAQISNPTDENQKPKKEIGKFAKGYTALLTALMVFPASFCTAINLTFHNHGYWFGYVVGFLIVAWVCLVLPVMKITPPAVTATICFVAIFGYLSFIMYKLGDIPFVAWLYQNFLPILVLIAIFVSIDTAMITSGKFNWMMILAAMSFETGVFFIALEFIHTRDLGNLKWSPIASCGFISVAAVFVAFSYIFKSNKK